MIGNYTEHAANERTFLAWIRTGISVIVFGFVIEKFNLFILTLGSMVVTGDAPRSMLRQAIGRLGRYDGLALIFGGVALIVLAAVRFTRTTKMLDDKQLSAAKSVRTELVISAALIILVAIYSIYLAMN